MKDGQQTPKDDAVKRVLIIFLVFGLVCFLPAVVRTYWPDYTAIIWRLVVTLVFAVVIVMVHRKVDTSRGRREDPVPGEAPWRHIAVRRILLLWLILFLLNTFFLAD